MELRPWPRSSVLTCVEVKLMRTNGLLAHSRRCVGRSAAAQTDLVPVAGKGEAGLTEGQPCPGRTAPHALATRYQRSVQGWLSERWKLILLVLRLMTPPIFNRTTRSLPT